MNGNVVWRCEMCHRYQPEGRKRCGNCRTTRSEAPAWHVYWYEPNGPGTNKRKRYERIGLAPSPAQAHARLAEIHEALRMGAAAPGARDTRTTLGQLRDWYLGLTDVQGRSSYREMERNLNKACAVLGADTPVARIDQDSIEAYWSEAPQHERRKEGPVSPATINRELASLSAMLHRAKRAKKIAGLELPQFTKAREHPRRRILEVAEELALWRSLPPPAESPYTAMLLLARYTGMREEEIVGLTWGEVSLSEGVIRLPAERTKEAKGKVIPLVIQARDGSLIDHALWALSARPRGLPAVRVFRDGPRNKDALSRQFSATTKALGFPHIRFHDLRRTFAVWMMLGLGYDRRVIKAITGHATDIAFDSYGTDKEREAMSVMGTRSPWAEEFKVDPVREVWRKDEPTAIEAK